MHIEEMVKHAAIFSDATSKDSELVIKLVDNGLKLEDAERFVAFMPIAAGRVVIKRIANVQFSDYYKTRESSGNEFSLLDEPIYMTALDLAERCYSDGKIDRDIFVVIAKRSAELDATNKALNAGEDINGASFAPVLLWGYKTLGKKQGFLETAI